MKCKRKSGGISIVYRKTLEKLLKFHKTPCEYVQWIQFKDTLLKYDILLGCVYIPPEGSKYSSVDAFTEIENEYLQLSNPNIMCALVGDFNAKTGTLPDYSIPDQIFLNILNIENENTSKFFIDRDIMRREGIPLRRHSECKCRPNTYGRRFLEMCKKMNIYI